MRVVAVDRVRVRVRGCCGPCLIICYAQLDPQPSKVYLATPCGVDMRIVAVDRVRVCVRGCCGPYLIICYAQLDPQPSIVYLATPCGVEMRVVAGDRLIAVAAARDE